VDFLITDGAPTDEWMAAAKAVHAAEKATGTDRKCKLIVLAEQAWANLFVE
jgi:uncharacterized protein YegL